MTDVRTAEAKRSPATELRLARKAFHNADCALNAARRHFQSAAQRLDKAHQAVHDQKESRSD